MIDEEIVEDLKSKTSPSEGMIFDNKEDSAE